MQWVHDTLSMNHTRVEIKNKSIMSFVILSKVKGNTGLPFISVMKSSWNLVEKKYALEKRLL